MGDFRSPQTPGIGGLEEITSAEEATLAAINALESPGADRILFWDHSALAWANLTAGTGLTITGTTMTASAGTDLSAEPFVTTTASANLSAETNLGLLATGFLFGTVAAGVSTISSIGSTGTGNVVLATSPTLVTPILGAASATSLTLTTDLAVADGGTGVSTFAVNGILYGNTASAIQVTAAAASSVLVTSALNVPSLSTDIPTAVTIGSAYIYRVSGTDVAVADGGTGLSSGTSGGILGYTATGTLASSVALTANALVLGGGAGATPTPMGSLGTTTTLLHGNAAGAPTFAAVSLTADVSGILPTANGGTGIAYFTAAGPTAARVYTFPDAATTVLTTNAAVTVAQGGTGVATLGDAGVLIGNGTGVVQVTGAGTSGQVLTSNGAGVDPTFQAAAGGGANEFTYVLTPSGATLPNSNFPALNKVVGATNITNTGAPFVYHVLDFDTTTREVAHWTIPIPPSVTPATHKLTILWTNASGLTTETVQWDIDWRSVSDDEVIDAITTPTTVNDTVSDTWIAQGDVHSVTVTLSSATNVIAGDNLQMTISRDVATDNMTGDARFIRAVYEITN